MKKKVWLFVLACIGCIAFAFAVAGCDGCSGCSDKAENISLSITNKEALTAEWLEEGENRTVELSITPEKYTVNNSEVVVTSDNSEVVKADGLTLSATGGGTANITVSLGKASDTVAIIVTPKLRGVSITNKDELGEVWGLGEADRTLDVIKLFKNSTSPLTASDVTVNSSAPEIIEADGFALKAKAIGDAEITVTYGDFTDKVTLSVVPALETFEIINKGEFADLALGTTYELSSYVTFGPSQYTAENTSPVITCEPAGIIEQVKGYQIKAASNGSATVTVTVRGKSDTFSVSVAYGTPEITFDVDEVGARFEETDEGGILSVLQTGYYNEETDVVLPTVYAMTSDGQTVDNIEIKKGEEVITGETVRLTKGTYQFTYSAADPRDNSKVATKTLTVNVYRNVIAAGDTNGYTLTEETRYSADENQVLKNSGNGYVTARLNMAPGKVYYTEATFVLSAYNSNPNYGGNPVLGMAHSLENGNGRRLSLVIGRATGNVFIRVANAGDNYYDNPIRQITNIKDAFSLTAPEGYVFPKDESAEAGKKVKIAIARDGDYFYLFMNDILIDMRAVSGFEDDTIPAITGDRLSETTMKNIVLLDGDAARNKINTFNTPGVEITNKDSLKAVWTNKYANRTVEAQITDLLPHCQGFVKFTVTSDNPDVISVDDDGVTLKAHKNGEATVTVTVGNKSDSVKITVELPAIPAGTPVIEFIHPEDKNVQFEDTEDGATLGVIQTGHDGTDTEVTLPAVNAWLDNADISDSLRVTLDGKATAITDNTVALSKGTHTLTYTATNAQNGVSVTKTLTVNVYRKIFSYKGPGEPQGHPEWECVVSKEYETDDKQEVTVMRTDTYRSVFNMAPSTLYYAEVTFILPAYNGSEQSSPIIGLGHFVGNETRRRLSCVVGRNTGNIFVTDYQSGSVWDDPIGGRYNVSDKTSLKEKDGYVFPKDESAEAGKKVKIAIARDGNKFYLFMNDVLIEVRDVTGVADGYYSDASIPGISGDKLSQTTLTNIVFLDGDAVRNEIAKRLPTPNITNKSAFAEKIDQTFTGKVEVSFTPEYYNGNTKVTFKSSDESVVKVGEDGTITAIANGEATITVTIGSKSDSVTVTVELKADTPVLTLTAPADGNVEYTVTEDGATLGVVQTGYCNEDTTVTLPTVTAKLGDTDISDSITVTIDGASTTLTGNTVALSKGAHTVTYTATNADNANSVTKTLTINVYRKIFSYKGPNQDAHPELDCIVSKEYAPDSEQEVTTTGTSVLRGVFNMTPSTLYYAEVTFVLPAYDDDQGNPIIGLGHYVGEEKARRLSYVVGRGTGSVFVADFTAGNGSIWDDPIGGKYNINTKTSLTEKDGYIFLKDTSTTAGKKVKLAIARSGNIYYLFMNDVLIEERDISGIDNGYYSAASVPGISADRMSKTTITDIRLLDAADATNKINGLLPKLTVSNQSELEKVWTEDGTRTVDYSVSGDILGAVTVTSSDPTVVSVDGTTLTAHKFGTANITVALAGGNTVNFTVTVQSKETGFEIANKTTVEAVWTYKENDEENNSRTLDVKAIFDRGGAKQTVPAGQLEVTSSDPQSVAVGGLTLTALKVSSSPVTITVKYKDFAAQTVTVNITDVVLESISLSKLMQGDSEITAQDEVYTVEAGKVYVVELAYNPADKFNADNTEAVIACADDGVIEEVVGAKNTFKAVGFGEHTVTVTVNGKTAQFKINVTRTAPEMTVTAPASGEFRGNEDGSYTLNTVQSDYYNEDSVIALPSVNASDCVGGTLTVDITAKDADGTDVTVTDGKITVATGMGYTVKFKATDPQDTSKFTEKTLIVNVYRKIFSYKGPNQDAHPEWDCVVSKENAADSAQEVTTTSTSRLRGVFNMAPSTLYYAEVTFILSAHDGDQGNPIIGLGHYVAKDNANNARRLSCVVGRASGMIFVADFTEGNGNIWDNPIGGSYNISTKTSLKEKDGYVFPANTSGTAGAKVKYAVARSGNTYYLFINDVLMEARDMTNVASGYYLNESVPGISGDRLSKTTITDINFFGGDEAQEKINSLTAATTTQSASVQRSPEAIVNKKEEE